MSRPNSRATLGFVLTLVVAGWAVGRISAREHDIVVYQGIEGPMGGTQHVERLPTSWRAFGEGGPSRLAVLLTDTSSSWLGVAHGLRTIGVPFRITRDHEEALRHRVVLVYPTISGKVLSPEALRALARFPETGGTLIGVNVEGGGLGAVFGFTEVVPARSRSHIIFDTDNPLAASFTHEREGRIPFANPDRGRLAAGSLGYLGAVTPLATFDDGSAAITARRVDSGFAYAFGVDPGFLLLRAYGNREEGVSRSYVNEYEPAMDVLLRTLLKMYEVGQPDAITLHTVPNGHDLTVLITHDIDFGESLANAEVFSQYEASVDVQATYFIQTKYVRDWNDRAFLDEEGVDVLLALSDQGMEIASHSVAHSLQFNVAPLGSGEERYPTYQPFVRDENRTEGATVLGELRVSRFLLEALVPGEAVVSFRPGHLRNPYALSEALEGTGYRFSSSVTAGNSLTHLPFRLTEGRSADVALRVFEFPVTVEDEEAPGLYARFDQTIALAERLEEYGGLLVVLIHTDEVDEKLAFERRLVETLAGRAWFGTVRDFGSFWAARDEVEIDVETSEGQVRAMIDAPQPVDGIALRLPKNHRVVSSEPSNLVRLSQSDRVVLHRFVGRVILTLAAID